MGGEIGLAIPFKIEPPDGDATQTSPIGYPPSTVSSTGTLLRVAWE